MRVGRKLFRSDSKRPKQDPRPHEWVKLEFLPFLLANLPLELDS